MHNFSLQKNQVISQPSCLDFACAKFGTVHLSYLPTFFLLFYLVFLNLVEEMALNRIEWRKMIHVADPKKLR